MNKLIITIVTTLLLTVTSTAFAQGFYGDPGRMGQRNDYKMQPMPLPQLLMRSLRQLDLDEDQQEGIRDVMQTLRTEVQPIMLEMRTGHEQLREMIRAGSYNEETVAALADKEGKLAADRIMLTGEAMSKVFGYLTDEQREQLDTIATQRKDRRTQGNRRSQGRQFRPIGW